MFKVGDMYKAKYYVYQHVIDDKIFYVGKGTRTRAVEFGGRNILWNIIVKDRLDEVDVSILASFDRESDAHEYEKKQIKMLSKSGIHLANFVYNNKVSEHLKLLGFKKDDLNFIADEKKKEIVNIEIPETYLNRPLTPDEKEKLCRIINLKDSQYRSRRWNSIHQLLNKSGYEVLNKQVRYEEKRIRVSIIKKLVDNDDSIFIDEKQKEIMSIKIPEIYLDKLLTPDEKEELCGILNLKDSLNRSRRWIHIHQMIKNEGYEVINKQVRDGSKRIRMSLIRELQDN